MKVLAILLLLTIDAPIGSRVPAVLDCERIRAAVQQYGEAVAYAWARFNGYTVGEIAEVVRRCRL